jgi:hypothetical protein
MEILVREIEFSLQINLILLSNFVCNNNITVHILLNHIQTKKLVGSNIKAQDHIRT